MYSQSIHKKLTGRVGKAVGLGVVGLAVGLGVVGAGVGLAVVGLAVVGLAVVGCGRNQGKRPNKKMLRR